MHDIGVAFVGACVSTCEPLRASKSTAAFRGQLAEIVWVLDIDNRFWMPRATELKSGANVSILLKHCNHLIPHGYLARCFSVTDDIHPVFGAREEHIHSVRSLEKAAFVFFVAAD